MSCFISFTLASILACIYVATEESLRHCVPLIAVLGFLSPKMCFCQPLQAKLTKFPYLRKTNCVTRSVMKTLYYFLKVHRFEDPVKKLNRVASEEGFNLEAFEVKTLDGYFLTLHRVTRENMTQNAPAIYIQHGLMLSSANFLVPGGLGFFLAKMGFDVYLGNFRGNIFSQTHENLTRKDAKFWHFSIDDLARFDVPAMINFVLEKSGREQIYYIGHSMGTTSFLAMISHYPEMNKKIKEAILLAPVTCAQGLNGLPSYFPKIGLTFINLLNR